MSLPPAPSPSSSTVPPKKRRKASESLASPTVSERSSSSPALIGAENNAVPGLVALPPPIMPHPSFAQHVAIVPSPYYPHLYHAAPFFVPVGSSQALQQPNYPVTISPRIHPKASVESDPRYFAAEPSNNPPSHILKTADERENARKMSHSAIERRRRERINDKILQLRQLIPSCADQDHLHKMTVLQSAIDYIAYLKGVVARMNGDVHVDLPMKKMPKPMVPKEVEKFTTQFSISERSSSITSTQQLEAPHPSSPTRTPSTDSDGTASTSTKDTSAAPTEGNFPMASLFQGPDVTHDQPLPVHPTAKVDQQQPTENCESTERETMDNDATSFATEHKAPTNTLVGLKPSDVIKSGKSLVSSSSPDSVASTDNGPFVDVSASIASLPSPMRQSFPSRSPSPVSAYSWNEDTTKRVRQGSDSSSSVLTPLLTPRTSGQAPKHMSLENILC